MRTSWPGLDDGPKDMSESLEMCRQAMDDGVTTIVATPHMNDGVYNVRRKEALEALAKFREGLDAEKFDLTIEPGGGRSYISRSSQPVKEWEYNDSGR